MKYKTLDLFSPRLMLVVLMLPVLNLHSQQRSEQGDFPERREIHQTYRLAHGANVEVTMIAGPVEIETTNDDTAEVNIIESAQTRADLDCYKTVVEQTPTRLVIRHEQSCSSVRDHQRVKLTLPRSVNVSLRSIAGFVHVAPIDGMLRLNSIAGEVTLTQVQTADISSLARGLTIDLAQPSNQGVRISSVTGGVDLKISQGVNTNLEITSVVGPVQTEASDISMTETPIGYQILIGSGGTPASVSSIIGGIRIHR